MEYTSVLEILSSSKISGRLSPFKPCVQLLSFVPNDGDGHTAFTSLRGLREARERGQTSVEGQPHHTPRGPGTLSFPLVKDTALILTRRAGQVCSACHSIGFRAVSRFTAVVRESPLPLCLLFLDAHCNRRMSLPMAGICCLCRGVCFLFPWLTS